MAAEDDEDENSQGNEEDEEVQESQDEAGVAPKEHPALAEAGLDGEGEVDEALTEESAGKDDAESAGIELQDDNNDNGGGEGDVTLAPSFADPRNWGFHRDAETNDTPAGDVFTGEGVGGKSSTESRPAAGHEEGAGGGEGFEEGGDDAGGDQDAHGADNEEPAQPGAADPRYPDPSTPDAAGGGAIDEESDRAARNVAARAALLTRLARQREKEKERESVAQNGRVRDQELELDAAASDDDFSAAPSDDSGSDTDTDDAAAFPAAFAAKRKGTPREPPLSSLTREARAKPNPQNQHPQRPSAESSSTASTAFSASPDSSRPPPHDLSSDPTRQPLPPHNPTQREVAAIFQDMARLLERTRLTQTRLSGVDPPSPRASNPNKPVDANDSHVSDPARQPGSDLEKDEEEAGGEGSDPTADPTASGSESESDAVERRGDGQLRLSYLREQGTVNVAWPHGGLALSLETQAAPPGHALYAWYAASGADAEGSMMCHMQCSGKSHRATVHYPSGSLCLSFDKQRGGCLLNEKGRTLINWAAGGRVLDCKAPYTVSQASLHVKLSDNYWLVFSLKLQEFKLYVAHGETCFCVRPSDAACLAEPAQRPGDATFDDVHCYRDKLHKKAQKRAELSRGVGLGKKGEDQKRVISSMQAVTANIIDFDKLNAAFGRLQSSV